MNNGLKSFVLVAALFLMAVSTGRVSAQTPVPQNPTPSDDAVNAVAKQLYCPVCENIPLDVCPTQECADWRELIRQKLAAGWNTQQIKDYFALQYGDRVLSEPPLRGLHWLVYILPPLFLLAGVTIVFRILRTVRKPVHSTVTDQVVVTDAKMTSEDPYVAKFEEELRRRQ